MISSDEIQAKSDEFEIHTSSVQRDYVGGWFLAGMYNASDLSDRLVLKGGNAFRKGYFEMTRYSADLDFGTGGDLSEATLGYGLRQACTFAEQKAGIVFEHERLLVQPKFAAEDQKILHARVYFHDFYGNQSQMVISVRMDVTRFDRLLAEPQSRFLIHPYSDSDSCRAEIRCVKLEELLATKIKCLLQRQHSFDLFDLLYSIFVNNQLAVDRSQIVRFFLQKTIFEPSPGVVRGLLLGLPVEIFRGFWDEKLACPRQSLFSFDKALEWFREIVEELFGRLPLGRQELAFFPAEYRNPIMQAGRTQTLLRVRYGRYEREVEPYALRYMQRQDGVAREYLYVYDRTGGRSGETGPKTFVAQNFERAENTEIAFEPRYEIELSKAGEFGEKRSFARGGSAACPPRRTKALRGTFGVIYIVQCPYCSRQFLHRTRTRNLHRHKDRYGNWCPGRSGMIGGQDYM